MTFLRLIDLFKNKLKISVLNYGTSGTTKLRIFLRNVNQKDGPNKFDRINSQNLLYLNIEACYRKLSINLLMIYQDIYYKYFYIIKQFSPTLTSIIYRTKIISSIIYNNSSRQMCNITLISISISYIVYIKPYVTFFHLFKRQFKFFKIVFFMMYNKIFLQKISKFSSITM